MFVLTVSCQGRSNWLISGFKRPEHGLSCWRPAEAVSISPCSRLHCTCGIVWLADNLKTFFEYRNNDSLPKVSLDLQTTVRNHIACGEAHLWLNHTPPRRSTSPRAIRSVCALLTWAWSQARLKMTLTGCLCHLWICSMLTASVLPLFSDEWESDEDDDESEWMDVYHSSDEEEEVQSVYSFFVFVQFLIVISRYLRWKLKIC